MQRGRHGSVAKGGERRSVSYFDSVEVNTVTDSAICGATAFFEREDDGLAYNKENDFSRLEVTGRKVSIVEQDSLEKISAPNNLCFFQTNTGQGSHLCLSLRSGSTTDMQVSSELFGDIEDAEDTILKTSTVSN